MTAGKNCELCGSADSLSHYEILPARDGASVQLCGKCLEGIEGPSSRLDAEHFHCLSDSMWSEQDAVKILVYRTLTRLKKQGWALELLEQLYLDEDLVAWALAGIGVEPQADSDSGSEPTLDSNGTALAAGDSVTLIKDLDVKGGGFTAKRGTLVKNISLTSNPEHVEGRVNGVQIVLVAKFLKKS